MAPPPAAEAVREVLGRRGDVTVLDYVASCLEDGEFEFGPDGEEAFEAFGEMLVSCLCLACGQGGRACGQGPISAWEGFPSPAFLQAGLADCT